MASENGRGSISCQNVAVILLLCCWVPSSTCFSLRGLSKNVKQDKVFSEATVTDVRTGRIFFNGKELNSRSRSSSAAGTAENERPMQDGPNQFNSTGTLTQASQVNSMANEAAWWRLNPSLHCGANQMKLRAMGPTAADLQLRMNGSHPLPLSQVPETCGYSMALNILGLVLLVPYDGCNVIQQNGDYMLPMTWQENPVEFTCPMLSQPTTTPAPSTTPKPANLQQRFPFPLEPFAQTSQKYDPSKHLSNYDPSLYYRFYNHYLYMLARGSAAPTTTIKPYVQKYPPIKPPTYPHHRYSPPYTPYSHYRQAKQVFPESPENSGTYYFPIIQNFYGYPTPGTAEPTVPTKTTTTFAPTTEPSTSSPGQTSSIVPYYQLPFTPPLAFNKSAKFPDDEKFMPLSFKSGLQPRGYAQPNYYWPPMPRFPSSTGQHYNPFIWRNLQPHNP